MFKFIDFILQFLYAKLCMHFGCTERGITILLYTAIFELWNMHVSSSRQKSSTPGLYKILENKAHAEVHLYTQIGYSCEIQKATKRERDKSTPLLKQNCTCSSYMGIALAVEEQGHHCSQDPLQHIKHPNSTRLPGMSCAVCGRKDMASA